MPVTQNNLDWLAARLLIETYDINQEYRRRRNTDRLESLYQEAMKFTITEPTFFQGSDRKVGDILDFPTGPVTYKRALNGKMEPVPQYVELSHEIQTPAAAPVSEPTPLPVNQLQSQEQPMSVTGIQSGAFEAKLADMRKKLSDRLMQGLTKIDGAAEAGAAKMDAAVDGIVAKVDKEIEDKLQEFATLTNGGPA